MKLVAIYNVWGDCLELLTGSINQIRSVVDGVVIVAQQTSNAGEVDENVYPFCEALKINGLIDHLIYYTPGEANLSGNETRKRQIGLDWAKEKGFTHFLHVDSDEYYETATFADAKIAFEYSRLDGSYIDLWTYYRSPTLRLKNKENYCVPFIHKLQANTVCGPQYRRLYNPVAVDPTRAINAHKVAKMEGISMHHYSYVRRDIEKKLRNSTARKNINKQSVLHEYANAREGTHLKALFNDTLIEVPNYFDININDYAMEERR